MGHKRNMNAADVMMIWFTLYAYLVTSCQAHAQQACASMAHVLQVKPAHLTN